MSEQKWRSFKVPKGRGECRTVYEILDEGWKAKIKELLPYLDGRLRELDYLNVNYAFLKGRNCVLHAMEHIGYQFTIKFDLSSFFDNVNPELYEKHIDGSIVSDCLIDGLPRQGIPTSPLICNIALHDYDVMMHLAISKMTVSFRYTRYADDIVISFNDISILPEITNVVHSVTKKYGFALNERKTKLQKISNGRIIITGVAIDEHGVYPTRKIKKKIRAAEHQNNGSSLKGLREWEKCNLPRRMVTNGGY